MQPQVNNTPQGHRLRIGRHSESNRAYLITTITHKREPIFRNLSTARITIKAMQTIQQQNFLTSYAFVIMPDHIHWLFQLGEKKSLAETIRHFKGHSAFNINKMRKHKHTKVWQPGYHDHALRKEEDIKTVARYIIANPLRAGLARSVDNYPLWDAIWL